jgi:hypothetical protein
MLVGDDLLNLIMLAYSHIGIIVLVDVEEH